MTTRRRLLPAAEANGVLDLLEARGIDLRQCIVDIGPDYVRVTPPANSNAGDSLAQYINRTPHRQKKDEKR